MSKIIRKAFDATQRISRALFRGSPNLFTTEDLNRQLEIFRRDIERLGMSSVVETDLVVDVDPNRGVISWTKGNYFYYGGMEISGALSNGEQPVAIVASWTSWYVLLCRTERVVTSADDPTHKISGAAFEDGTTNPAADHVVCDFTIAVHPNLSGVSGIVAILARVFISPDGKSYYSFTNLRDTGTPLVEHVVQQIKIPQLPSGTSTASATLYRGQPMWSAFETLLKKFTLNHDLTMSDTQNSLSLLEYTGRGAVAEVLPAAPLVATMFKAGVLIISTRFYGNSRFGGYSQYNAFLDSESQAYPYPLGCNWGDTDGYTNGKDGEDYQYIGHVMYNSDLHKHLERTVGTEVYSNPIYIGPLGVYCETPEKVSTLTNYTNRLPIGLFLERITFMSKSYWCFTARPIGGWELAVANGSGFQTIQGAIEPIISGYGWYDGRAMGYHGNPTTFMLPLTGI